MIVDKTSGDDKVCVVTTIKVFRKDGSLKAKRVIKDDLLLDNFIEYHKDLANLDVSLTLTDGTDVTWDLTAGNTDESQNYEAYWSPDNKIAVGTGTTSPSRSDYDMESTAAETTEVTVDLGTGFVSWSATITLSSATDVTETGLYSEVPGGGTLVTNNPSHVWLFLMRETFSAISVAAGESISISFEAQY